jgi:hypothetical protein
MVMLLTESIATDYILKMPIVHSGLRARFIATSV